MRNMFCLELFLPGPCTALYRLLPAQDSSRMGLCRRNDVGMSADSTIAHSTLQARDTTG